MHGANRKDFDGQKGWSRHKSRDLVFIQLECGEFKPWRIRDCTLECVQIERRIEILRMLEKVAEILKLCMIIFKNTPLIGN